MFPQALRMTSRLVKDGEVFLGILTVFIFETGLMPA